MSVTLREIVRQVQHLEMKLVAGEEGIDREVLWTHMVDSSAISAFLKGKELAFTTGIGLHEGFSLLQLVKEIYRNGASGIVINIGPYISEIGQDVKDFADANDFPVFEVPWKIHMAEIMRIICFAVVKEQQNQTEVNSALNYAFLCPDQDELYVSLLMQKGYPADAHYMVAVLRVQEGERLISGEKIGHFSSVMNSHFRCSGQQILCCAQEKQMVFLLCDYEEKECNEILKRIFRDFCRKLEKEETAVMSIGKKVFGLRCLHRSYETANQLADISRTGNVSGEIRFGRNRMLIYQNAGMLRLLLSVNDQEVMREYVEDTVLPVLEYDALHNSDLSGVLQCYLRHDCSLQDTADELIIHRNTVNYKINKISEILSMDLTKMENRLQVSLGFAVYQVLQKK